MSSFQWNLILFCVMFFYKYLCIETSFRGGLIHSFPLKADIHLSSTEYFLRTGKLRHEEVKWLHENDSRNKSTTN